MEEKKFPSAGVHINNKDRIYKDFEMAILEEKQRQRTDRTKANVSKIEHYVSREITKIRTEANLLTEQFAEIFGVPVETIEAWEEGSMNPDPASRRLLMMIEHDPKILESTKTIRL